jgi:phage baseplate assembly protein W
VARTGVYADIDNAFTVHPIYNDIRPISDLDAVRQSIKNLLLTETYDRPFQPELSSGIRELLFENANVLTQYELQRKIEDTIKSYEPRLKDFTVSVTDDSDNNAYRISVSFEVSYNQTTEIVIYLTRIR